MAKVVEIIDVDDLPDPSSDDSEIVFTGFKREASRSSVHSDLLNTEGFVYTGFNETPKPPPPQRPSQPLRRTSYSLNKTSEHERVTSSSMEQHAAIVGAPAPSPAIAESAKRSLSRSTAGPPSKRQKRTHEPTTTNPHLKRDHATMRTQSRNCVPASDVIYISDSDDEKPEQKKPVLSKPLASFGEHRRRDRSTPTGPGKEEPVDELTVHMDIDIQEEEYATAHAALDLDYRANWGDLKDARDIYVDVHGDDSDDDELVLRTAALAVTESMQTRSLERIGRQQQQSNILDWSNSPRIGRKPHIPYACARAVRTALPRRKSRWQYDFSLWTGLYPARSIQEAPGDINTIAQSNGMIVMASAVADGAIDDVPGPYNANGSLVISLNNREYILDNHSLEVTTASGQLRRHYFTVNDVTIDPSDPIRFLSAGRDNRVLVWDCERIQEGGLPEVVEEIDCDDNPEVVQYHLDGSTFAIQCDNGSVYLHREDAVSRLVVAPAGLGHVTAEMAWGVHASRHLLFASSACMADSSGHHKAFDVVRNKVVVEFDAAKEACSTLTLDPVGERLFIATEGSESTYTLRQFDVRTRDRKAVQKVDLEPFADIQDKLSMDVNSLSLSSDGIYIAAGRTDNWADVYDSRMLARGPLYSFAHEDAVSAEKDKFGIVKTQWVDGMPHGVGLVTGGIDGCVRLWDVRLAADDPLNGTILARCDYDVATFTLGDIYKGDKPIIVGERSGKVTTFDHCKGDKAPTESEHTRTNHLP